MPCGLEYVSAPTCNRIFQCGSNDDCFRAYGRETIDLSTKLNFHYIVFGKDL
jgi:hypothetical protein